MLCYLFWGFFCRKDCKQNKNRPEMSTKNSEEKGQNCERKNKHKNIRFVRCNRCYYKFLTCNGIVNIYKKFCTNRLFSRHVQCRSNTKTKVYISAPVHITLVNVNSFNLTPQYMNSVDPRCCHCDRDDRNMRLLPFAS